MIQAKTLTASGVVSNVSGSVHSVNITKVGTGTSSVTVYDNASAASGDIIFQGDGLTEMSYPLGNFAGGGVIASQGIYVALAGTTNPTVVISFEQ